MWSSCASLAAMRVGDVYRGGGVVIKALLGGIVLASSLLIVKVATSHGDSAVSPPFPSEAPAEPITGSPVTPAASSEPPAQAPFTSYPPGPAPTTKTPKPYWHYEDLSTDAKAALDAAREVTGRAETANAFGAAAAERAHKAAGEAAQHQLGVDNLGTIGVVP